MTAHLKKNRKMHAHRKRGDAARLRVLGGNMHSSCLCQSFMLYIFFGLGIIFWLLLPHHRLAIVFMMRFLALEHAAVIVML